MADQMATQWICSMPAFCRCTGEAYSCDCLREGPNNTCRDCKSDMHEINVDTGEPVAAVA